MKIEEILEREIKRLSRINGRLEGYAKNNKNNLDIYDHIRNNSATIVELLKNSGMLVDAALDKLNTLIN